MEVAASKGLPPLKHHLLPRTKGFTTAVQCLRGTGRHPGLMQSLPATALWGPSSSKKSRDLLKTSVFHENAGLQTHGEERSEWVSVCWSRVTF